MISERFSATQAPAPQPADEDERIASDKAQPVPDVSADRVPATDREPSGRPGKAKNGPLGIQEIENLEDDAKGG